MTAGLGGAVTFIEWASSATLQHLKSTLSTSVIIMMMWLMAVGWLLPPAFNLAYGGYWVSRRLCHSFSLRKSHFLGL